MTHVKRFLAWLRRHRTAPVTTPLPVPVPPAPPRRRHRSILVVGLPRPEPSPDQRRDEAVEAARRAGLAFHLSDVPAPIPVPDGQVVGVAHSPRW